MAFGRLPDGGGYQFDKWELLELSLVAVPCNPQALILQRSFLGKSSPAMSADDRADHVDAVHRHLGMLKHYAADAGRHGDGLSKVMDWADSAIMRAQKHAHALGADVVIDRLDKAELARFDIVDAVDALRARIADLARHVCAAQDHADALDGGAAKALRRRCASARARSRTSRRKWPRPTPLWRSAILRRPRPSRSSTDRARLRSCLPAATTPTWTYQNSTRGGPFCANTRATSSLGAPQSI